MATHYTAGQSALFVQDGPNRQPMYLGCHQIDDIEEPFGDSELIQCPDPAKNGGFQTVGSIEGAADAISTSLTFDFTDEVDPLETVQSGATIFVHKAPAGRRDVFNNFGRTIILSGARKTTATLSAMSARSPDDNGRSEQSIDLTAEKIWRYKTPTITRQTTANTGVGADVSFWSYDRPRTSTNSALRIGDRGFAAAADNVLKTINGGASWAVAFAQPFGLNGVINSVESFEVSDLTPRILAGNSYEDAAAAMEVAYSDDLGTTTTVVTVGSAVSSGVGGPRALYAYDRNNCWVGSSKGHIYKSTDGGASWTLIDNAIMQPSKKILAFHFSNPTDGFVVGDDNFVARTIDGLAWSELTGPGAGTDDFNCVHTIDRMRAWIGSNVGKLYYTEDGGATWTERATGLTGSILSIKFTSDGQIGYLASNTAAPLGKVYATIDGGYSWYPITVPTNSGLAALDMSSPSMAYLVGLVDTGTTFIAKLS